MNSANRLIVLIFVVMLGHEILSQDLRTIHVFVALCDNENQNIIKVSDELGNGQDPANNLYWGALYGVKSYFENSEDWTLISTINRPDPAIIERLLFKHNSSGTYMLADAYSGKEIKDAISDFLLACSGDEGIKVDSLKFGGGSNLLAYVGHDGLMDFDISERFSQKDETKREAIILACNSKHFFYSHLEETGAYPLVWTTWLMAPEAYTLKGAIEGWILNETYEQINERAVKAYSDYQKCGLNAARRLLVTGW